MANIKISKVEYNELIESKAFADDVANVLEILSDRTGTWLVSGDDFGSGIIMMSRSYIEKRKRHKYNK